MYEGNFLAVACGGGRNSAMLLGMYERGIQPDLITFANTGRLDHTRGEKPQTYEAIVRLSNWCKEKFNVPIVEVHKNSIYQSLYDQCIETKTLPSAAYGLRSCSDKWKIQPQDKFMNNYPPARKVWWTCENCGDMVRHHKRKRVVGTDGQEVKLPNGRWQTQLCCTAKPGTYFEGKKITKAIGYDSSELRRAKIEENEKYRYRYFLIEWGWYLEDCIDAFKRHGLPVPYKSACYFCPSSRKEEVIALWQNQPELFWSAVEMEDNAIAAGTLQSVKGLGRHWTWRELIQLEPDRRATMIEAPAMQCACFDTEDDD